MTEDLLAGGVAPPKEARYLALLGEAYAKRGETAKAEDAFARALAARPGDPVLWTARARFLEGLGRKEQAEADHAKALEAAGKNSVRLRALADDYAMRGEWARAAAVFPRLLEAAPSNVFNWMQPAPLLLQLGDVEGYRRQCRRMMDRYQDDTDPLNLEKAAKVSLITDGPPDDVRRAARLADRAVTVGENSPYLVYLQVTKGIAEYREGHYDSAVKWLERAKPGDNQSVLKAMTGVFLALAYHRAGRPDDARRSLNEAQTLLDQRFPPNGPPDINRGGEWHDWLICQIVRREAEALLGVSQRATPPDRPAS
jgi:tetratricopeptide (TPR) repeat protein